MASQWRGAKLRPWYERAPSLKGDGKSFSRKGADDLHKTDPASIRSRATMPDHASQPELTARRELVGTLRTALAASRQENALLRQKVEALVRRVFGASSERLDPAQLECRVASKGEQCASKRGQPCEQRRTLPAPRA